MAEKAVGTIVLSIDGDEYDVTSFAPTERTGKVEKPTMNRQRRTKHVAQGNKSYAFSLEVVIPDGKDLVDWTAIEDARLSIESPEGGFRETYIDCHITEQSATYSVSGETMRSLSGFALDKIDESI